MRPITRSALKNTSIYLIGYYDGRDRWKSTIVLLMHQLEPLSSFDERLLEKATLHGSKSALTAAPGNIPGSVGGSENDSFSKFILGASTISSTVLGFVSWTESAVTWPSIVVIREDDDVIGVSWNLQ
ncbi:hypothetical protein AC1031_002249 [Aphanomyces cochlioides]|nr:hypothetical protein AC1031_002249 [Aphanomyces cochlioides]